MTALHRETRSNDGKNMVCPRLFRNKIMEKKYVRISARIAQRISKLTSESHCAELTAEDPAAGEGPALPQV